MRDVMPDHTKSGVVATTSLTGLAHPWRSTEVALR
jgi:hypothetical protein